MFNAVLVFFQILNQFLMIIFIESKNYFRFNNPITLFLKCFLITFSAKCFLKTLFLNFFTNLFFSNLFAIKKILFTIIFVFKAKVSPVYLYLFIKKLKNLKYFMSFEFLFKYFLSCCYFTLGCFYFTFVCFYFPLGCFYFTLSCA